MAAHVPVVGEYVKVRVQDPRYNDESLVWQVQETSEDPEARVTVFSQRLQTSIKVRRQALSPPARAELHQDPTTDLALQQHRSDELITSDLATQSVDRLTDLWENNGKQTPSEWLALPGYGGNTVRFVPVEKDEPGLIFYPVLRKADFTVEFQSTEFAYYGIIRLKVGDVLAWCPAIHVWVFCYLCKKFHFPPHGQFSHRLSHKHLKRVQTALSWGYEDTRNWHLGYAASSRELFHFQ